ncbi:hypothetical protein FOZ63_007061, partial [Perkinsus olseni]
ACLLGHPGDLDLLGSLFASPFPSTRVICGLILATLASAERLAARGSSSSLVTDFQLSKTLTGVAEGLVLPSDPTINGFVAQLLLRFKLSAPLSTVDLRLQQNEKAAQEELLASVR